MAEVLNSITANPRVNVQYPHIYIEGLSEALSIVIRDLEEGDLPIIVHHNDILYKVASISRSALVVSKLLRITPIVIYRSETDYAVIRSNVELLEGGPI